MSESDLARLIEDVSNSLHTELRGVAAELSNVRGELTEATSRIEAASRVTPA